MIFGTRYKMESWGAYSETIKDVKTMTAEKWDCTGGNSRSQPPFQIITDGSYHHLTSYILHLTYICALPSLQAFLSLHNAQSTQPGKVYGVIPNTSTVSQK